ncbi:hypothetical protein H8356DRAFT_1321380 [Neocallimastix lanati (nom. inval.)]|nr:hypothetical protein H8356DRAFT_1321380 [Neocallimastix sp. JGI-2020a]
MIQHHHKYHNLVKLREKVIAKKPARLFDSETQDSRMFREDITFCDSYYESPLNNIINAGIVVSHYDLSLNH